MIENNYEFLAFTSTQVASQLWMECSASGMIDGWLLSNRCDVAKEVAEKILDGVAADILVANWDVIGWVNDNIVVENEGTPVRIDNGGSFMFRALGSLKPPAQLLAIDERH
jgi:hypothetical protein